jgi:hypothetical protein
MVSASSGTPSARRNRRDRIALVIIIAFAVLGVLVAIGVTPFGGWIQSFFYGTGARWQDVYTALEAAETNLPRHAGERERLLLANAHADSEPPLGLKIGPRLHPVGTLARLRYETFDENGERIDEWQVRALVPQIGGEHGPYWDHACPRPCQEETRRSGGTRIYRSGEPGIAEEWVLRMPVGRPFELKSRPLQMQDILDTRPRRLPLTSVRVGDRHVQRPAKILVTLVEACPAQVRTATVLNFEFDSNTVPMPRGFQTTRWVQLDGCGQLEQLPPPPRQERPVHITPETAVPAALETVSVRRQTGTGHAALKVNEMWLQQHNAPVSFQVINVCRYDATTNRWQALPPPDPRVRWRIAPQSGEEARSGERTAFELPRETALFWVGWTEEDDRRGRPQSAGNVLFRQTLVTSGPVLCNDIAIGTLPIAQVAACVPFADHAEARFVPDPAEGCRQ